MADETRSNDAFKVMVKNLNGSTTEDDVRQFFAPCGEIVDLFYRNNDRGAFAFVGFTSDEALGAALKLSGEELGGSTIEVSRKGDRPARVNNDANKVFLSNLTDNTTEDDVRNFFADCGEINDLCVRHNDRGAFAFVGFTTAEGSNAALNMAGQELNGSVVGVRVKEARNAGGRGGGRGGYGRRDDYGGGRGGGYGGRGGGGGYGRRDRDDYHGGGGGGYGRGRRYDDGGYERRDRY